jgi:hypothetical protein
MRRRSFEVRQEPKIELIAYMMPAEGERPEMPPGFQSFISSD